MSRVERMFGARKDWGKGNERERVEAGKDTRKSAKTGATPPPTSLRSATSPSGGGEKAAPVAGDVTAGELKKAGFAKGGEPEGVKGFVSIRCGGCGKVINTCLREKRTIFNCKSCGHPNPLEHLKTMKVECPRCSFRGRYQTNREEDAVVMECLNCSHPVPLRRGKRRGNYVTIREATE